MARWLALGAMSTLACATTRAPAVSSLERRVRELEDRVYALQRANDDMKQMLARVGGVAQLAAASEPATVLAPGAGVSAGTAARSSPTLSPPVRAYRGPDDPDPGPRSATASPGLDGDAAWRRAKETYDRTRYEQAIPLLRGFVRDHADHPRAVEAQYLLGESYYAEANFAQAIVEFGKVADNSPRQPQAADALYKIALSYYEIGYANNAREYLQRLRKSYPDSAAAASSESLLERLR